MCDRFLGGEPFCPLIIEQPRKGPSWIELRLSSIDIQGVGEEPIFYKQLNDGLNKLTAYFIKCTRTRTWTFRKVGPWNFRKTVTYAKTEKSLVKNSSLTNWMVLISYMTTINFQSKNTQIRQFFPKFNFFCSHKALHFDKFECAEFKYDNSFFSSAGLKLPVQGIFGPKPKVFLLYIKLSILTNSRLLISSMAIVFPNSSPKIPNKAILVLNLLIFWRWNFTVWQIQSC